MTACLQLGERGGIAVALEVTLDVSLKNLHPEEQSNEEPFSIR